MLEAASICDSIFPAVVNALSGLGEGPRTLGFFIGSAQMWPQHRDGAIGALQFHRLKFSDVFGND